MKSKLAFLVVFSCFLQICCGDKDDVSNDTDGHRKKVGEPCKVCEEVVGNVISLRRSNGSRGDMYDYITDLCLNYTNYGPKACRGMVDIKLDTALYIIDNKENLTAARFCSINFQSYGCKDPDAESWSIPLPPLSSGINTQISDKNVTTVAHILHVTDIHYDPQYKWNSNAHCKQPLCCESGSASTSNEAAGYWGDYHVCDTPWSVIENLFSRLGGWHRRTIDWMYFTGDIVDHRSWATSVKGNSDSITKILKLFYTTFPNKTLYPILGNHESHPADFFAPDSISKNINISTQWLYDLAAKEWLRWLPDTTEATIKKGGFYTVLVKPGFRIIALNSNVCYVENIWLVYDDKDPYGQLQWLVDVLTEAEKNGEKVHILSHVPPGEISCHRQWSHEFKQIVLRFSDTIIAQFNGHTHTDEFKLFFNSSSLEVKGVAFNGGSLTSYIGLNPNYRIYEINNETMAVTNYEQYTFNLSVANLDPQIEPAWHKLYTIKGAYALPDLELETLGDFFWQMTMNNSVKHLVKKYYSFMSRNSDMYSQQKCNEACRKKLVCRIAATDTDETLKC